MTQPGTTQHPSLPGRLAADGLADSDQSWPVSGTDVKFESPYVSLRVDTIVDSSGEEHSRAVVTPNGAVAVVALDEDDRVLLVEQYRHPTGRRLLELPAGTLDVEGEAPLDAAKRELAEEADVAASSWAPLLDLVMTPGYSSERIQVFVATDVTAVAHADRTKREAEEADMAQWWVPFDDAVDAVLSGRITDAKTVAAILAVQVSRPR
jgi:8-oxo-dGTP pyrophosphatase MutT (NUDIX family)